MEIQAKNNALIDPYAATLEKNSEAIQNRRSKTNEQQVEVNSGDKISVSQDALLLTEARRTAQATPDIRQDKVDAIRMQVENGTYKVDNKLIAENLIREESALFKV